jgi:hypothetical protein
LQPASKVPHLRFFEIRLGRNHSIAGAVVHGRSHAHEPPLAICGTTSGSADGAGERAFSAGADIHEFSKALRLAPRPRCAISSGAGRE